jgi:hypothetical protein
MANKIKLLAIGAALLIGGSVAGYFLRPIINPVTITVTNGVNNGGEEKPEKIKTNTVQADCLPYVLKYNDLAFRFDAFLSAPPIIESVGNGKINFSILKNKYSLDYSLNDKPRMRFIAGAGAGYIHPSGIIFSASGGVQYDFIQGMASVFITPTAPYIAGAGASVFIVF